MCPVHGECEEVRGAADAGIVAADEVFTALCGQGIVEIDDDGVAVRTLPVGVRGLLDLPYRDIASLGDDRFLLIADNEGYLWDAVTEHHRVHFCVEPGFVACFDENGELIDGNNNGVCDWDEAQPQPCPEPSIVQRNDALGLVGNDVVRASGLILPIREASISANCSALRPPPCST